MSRTTQPKRVVRRHDNQNQSKLQASSSFNHDNGKNKNNNNKKKKNNSQQSPEETMMTELVALVRTQFQSLADPDRAVAMKKYLKTDMPMYGVPRPLRLQVEKQVRTFLAAQYPPSDTGRMTMDTYLEMVETLWNLPMREEKYLAIDLAINYYEDCVTSTTATAAPKAVLSLVESMLRQDYMWWDLVDPIATYLVGKVASKTIWKRWIRDENIWIRRSALLAQLKFQHRTDEALLFQFCQQCAPEKEFFIRKAIGWALREYSKTSPEAVKTFLQQEKSNLSGLSYREGAKILMRQGLL
jgi:3-methyladenine DNA glycosylase AlkD